MALSITSMTFDQGVYSPGSTITLTVDYTSDDSTVGDTEFQAAVTVADAANTASASAPFMVATGEPVVMPTTVTATDNRTPAGTWTLASNDLTGTGPFTGVAVLTSVA